MKRWMIAALIVAVFVAFTGFGLAEEKAAAKEAEKAVGEMQKVESTLIKSVAYDPAKEILTIVFVKDNEKYEYKKVSEKVYKEMMAADSKGEFFHKHIKGKYKFTQIKD